MRSLVSNVLSATAVHVAPSVEVAIMQEKLPLEPPATMARERYSVRGEKEEEKKNV